MTKLLSKSRQKNLDPDPLYVIFEQHLFNFQDDEMDRQGFIKNVVNDYLSFIRKKNIAIPPTLENAVREELGSLVGTMLLKKIYGCLSLQQYQKTALGDTKRKARTKYNRLKTG